MRYLTLVFFILTLLKLSACSSWPNHGKGGFAEHNLGSLIPVEVDHALRPTHGLRFDFELQKQLLDQLILKGADKCFPASVRLAKLRQNQCARLIRGQLYGDAELKVLEQRLSLAELERKTNAIGLNYHCPSKPHVVSDISESESDKNRLLRLLNSDNQFAEGSWKINPKYRGNLTLAAELLTKFNTFQLHIYGHTDNNGTHSFNIDLSKKRSEAVTDLLVSLGIQKDRISTDYKGEYQPLFVGNGEEVNLVNRRVSIALSSKLTWEK